MRHQFKKVDFPPGDRTVTEYCDICKAARVRYDTGSMAYLTSNGSKSPHATPCIGGSAKPEIQPIYFKVAPPEIPAMVPMEEKLVIHESKSTLTPTDARLKETIVIIRVMYEDMIKNNVNTTGRNMAGRFLYSHGYEELVKQLNK